MEVNSQVRQIEIELDWKEQQLREWAAQENSAISSEVTDLRKSIEQARLRLKEATY